MRNSGIILITTLWILAMLSLLSLSFAHQMRIEVKLAGYYTQEAQLRQLAKAAVKVALAKLGSDTNDYDALNETWRVREEEPDDCLLELIQDYPGYGIQIEYTIVDEESKLNVNEASLESLLSLPGVTEEAANSVIDWRDEDNEPLPYGAENSYYQSLPTPYSCKNAPFDSAGELLHVRGVTTELFYGNREENIPGLKDMVTVWGEQMININTAPEEILVTIPGVRAEIIDLIIERRAGSDGEEGTEDDKPFESVASIEEISGITAEECENLQNHSDVKSSYFTVEAIATSAKNNLSLRTTAIVEREEDSLTILRWEEK